MPTKRQRTGGKTGLTNVQYIVGNTSESAANTYTEEEIKFGIIQPSSDRMRNLVRIKSIVVDFPGILTADLTHTLNHEDRGVLGIAFRTGAAASNTDIDRISDPYVITKFVQNFNTAMSAATVEGAAGYAFAVKGMHEKSFVEENNQGYLLATDSLFVQVKSNSMATAKTYSWRIYFDVVSASILDYVSILQSQRPAQ